MCLREGFICILDNRIIIFYESWKISIVLKGVPAERRVDEVISRTRDVQTVLLETARPTDFYVAASDVFPGADWVGARLG